MSDQEEPPMTNIASVLPNAEDLQSSYNTLTNLNLGLLILAGMIALAIGLVAVLSTRKGNDLIRAKDEQLKRDLKDKDAQIERARADAETRLQVETTKVKADADASLKLETAKVRADADVKIGEATKQADVKIAEANERTASVSLRLEEEARKRAEAQQETAKAQQALVEKTEEIRLRQLPRHLTPEQRARLVEILKSSPKGEVDIVCVLGDGEGFAFATELDGVLKAAGWTASGGGVSQVAYSGGNPIGAGIIVHSSQTVPPYAAALQHAFELIGFPLPGAEKSDLPAGKVQLLIGNKP